MKGQQPSWQMPLALLGAMVFSVTVYVGVAWLMRERITMGPLAWPPLRWIFFGLGLMLVALPHFLEPLLAPHQAPLGVFMVGLALCEGPAILGLVLFFLGLPFREFLYFVGLALVGMLVWSLSRLGTFAEERPP